ncbi:MAG: hypothetical protein A2632_02345 [Candidatus Pacebacteria bacterium RIFCSPHIGHO2_01_FULL_46_16]|nr:MAG: hypothetical protein A2632_02345 [Candidatus Pacebacteria bacterium RIFCSPHIGHO2_01_FULL_46_16]OGJ22277.1 MAG: hypothetical protein A3J60_04140 [Candidatus Pacebacteria bacterium RIFCSPHIGHO2_02_FULL_46_9]OGJ38226.1 MAG: hypothetical protein A3A82_01305 [Candidatus Pacebacteria bacterium RIFCSPLOWO2_01_FULL_47_12]
MTKLDTFNSSVLGAINHRQRAEEGKRLLGEGRSLSEMRTPVAGMTNEENTERRAEFLTLIGRMTQSELGNQLTQIEKLIEFRLGQEEKGASELEWRRIMVIDLLEK